MRGIKCALQYIRLDIYNPSRCMMEDASASGMIKYIYIYVHNKIKAKYVLVCRNNLNHRLWVCSMLYVVQCTMYI